MVENVQNPMNEPRYSGIPTFMRAPLATNLNMVPLKLDRVHVKVQGR
jgi:hypothetical protein